MFLLHELSKKCAAEANRVLEVYVINTSATNQQLQQQLHPRNAHFAHSYRISILLLRRMRWQLSFSPPPPPPMHVTDILLLRSAFHSSMHFFVSTPVFTHSLLRCN